MREYYPAQIDEYLRANYPAEIRPGGDICFANDGDGKGPYLVSWPDRLGKAPTPEEVKAWSPPPRVALSAQIDAALAPGKLGTATTASKANAAISGIEALVALLKERHVI